MQASEIKTLIKYCIIIDWDSCVMITELSFNIITSLVQSHTEMPRLSQGGHKVVTRWSQGGHKVVALSQGCFKLVTTLYKIPRLSQVLSQGCHKVVKWL